MLARLPDAPMLAILAEAHAPDEHPAHQGHTPVLYRLLDGSPAAGLAWSIKDLCTSSTCLYAASSLLPTVYQPVGGQEAEVTHLLPTVCWTVGGQAVLRLSLGGVCPYTPPTAPHFFFAHYWADSPGKDEKIWVLGRGPHAAIEMRKENPRRNDTGRDGEVLVQPNPMLTETGSKVKFQQRMLQEQTEGGQRSWTGRSRILPEQRQDALKEGLCWCTRRVYEISFIAPQASVMPNELVPEWHQMIETSSYYPASSDVPAQANLRSVRIGRAGLGKGRIRVAVAPRGSAGTGSSGTMCAFQATRPPTVTNTQRAKIQHGHEHCIVHQRETGMHGATYPGGDQCRADEEVGVVQEAARGGCGAPVVSRQ
ncbi:hypothetical protein B0H14DRAFT_3144360 [Mycena olivaceomarginata]|nr:hypothetical protein B0H14DRAFT_3144360 [Mycena olivaceomarginata]